MGKKLVICCDGTGNSFDRPLNESNVAKLYASLEIDSQQIAYYHPGVGTMGAPNERNWVKKQWSRIKGLAFGAGLLDNIGDAYRYLMNNYVDGDEIFLFGFSRGAYTVRGLASILHVFGLLCAGNEGLIPYILQMYSKRTRKANHQRTTFQPDDVFKWQFAHASAVKIHFCGLWDTVSAYGWAYNPIKLPFDGFNPIILKGRHAISIHERRCFYRDNLWGAVQGHQDIKQVWFAGVHSDVGGSYDEDMAALSKITLEWMFVEAGRSGLNINIDKAQTVLGRACPNPAIPAIPVFVPPDRDGWLHKSLHGCWWILEILPHRYPDLKGQWTIPLGRPRKIPANSIIHESVVGGPWEPSHLPPHAIEPWVSF